MNYLPTYIAYERRRDPAKSSASSDLVIELATARSRVDYLDLGIMRNGASNGRALNRGPQVDLHADIGAILALQSSRRPLRLGGLRASCRTGCGGDSDGRFCDDKRRQGWRSRDQRFTRIRTTTSNH